MRVLPHTRPPLTALATAGGLLALIAWDASNLDLWLARLAGTSSGFAGRDHWFLSQVLHQGARNLTGLLVAALAISVLWPWGPLRALTQRRRLWLLAAVVGGMILPASLKRLSVTSCPWELREFGGAYTFVSHWRWWQSDGGPGHCFPAGHASSAFAWVAGFFVWPPGSALARRWLWTALIAGLVIGIAQQLRGAHFMSHTLWTAWICWAWAWGLSALIAKEPHAPLAD